MEKRDDFNDISQENDSQKEELMENEENKEAALTDEELDDVTGAQLGWRPQPVRKKYWKRTYWKLPF